MNYMHRHDNRVFLAKIYGKPDNVHIAILAIIPKIQFLITLFPPLCRQIAARLDSHTVCDNNTAMSHTVCVVLCDNNASWQT